MNDEQLKEHIELTTDKTFRFTAERLVLKCGIRADLKGSDALADCVILYGVGAVTGYCDIYRAVGKLRGVSSKSVIREISYAIAQAFDIEEKFSARQAAGYSLFIAYRVPRQTVPQSRSVDIRRQTQRHSVIAARRSV